MFLWIVFVLYMVSVSGVGRGSRGGRGAARGGRCDGSADRPLCVQPGCTASMRARPGGVSLGFEHFRGISTAFHVFFAVFFFKFARGLHKTAGWGGSKRKRTKRRKTVAVDRDRRAMPTTRRAWRATIQRNQERHQQKVRPPPRARDPAAARPGGLCEDFAADEAAEGGRKAGRASGAWPPAGIASGAAKGR